LYLSEGKLNYIEPSSKHELAAKGDHIHIFIVSSIVCHQIQVACKTGWVFPVLNSPDFMEEDSAQSIGSFRATLLGMIKVCTVE
jgi:hypothetical protein